MKATLTIEVPDDFIKGQCWRCKLHESDADYDSLRCSAIDGTILDAYDCSTSEVMRSGCPLEIQERNGDCETCIRLYDDDCEECRVCGDGVDYYEPYIPKI